MHSVRKLLHKHINTLCLLSIGVMALVIYAQTWFHPLLWDDEETVVTNGHIRSVHYIPLIFKTGYHGGAGNASNIYRPLATLSFLVEYHLWKLHPSGYHVTNTILHAANSMAVYIVLMALFRRRGIAWCTSILFAIHPINAEVVNYVSHRPELLMLFFYVMSLYWFIRYCEKRTWYAFLFSFILFWGALLSKEMGMSLPLFLLLYAAGCKKRSRTIFYALIPYGLSLLIYVSLRMTVLNFTGATGSQYAAGSNLGVVPLTMSQILMTYMRIFLYPRGLHMERDIPVVTQWNDAEAWVCVGGIILGILGLIAGSRKSRVMMWGSLCFFITYLPISNVLPLQIAIAEHYMYVPSIGVFMLVSCVFLWIGKMNKELVRTSLLFLGVMMVVMLGMMTVARNREWRDPVVLYTSTVTHSKNCFRSLNNLGVEYFRRGNIEKAYTFFSRSLAVYPQYTQALNNLGVCFERTGDVAAAIQYYIRALHTDQTYWLAHKNVGFLLLKVGNIPLGKEHLEKAHALYPFDEEVKSALRMALS